MASFAEPLHIGIASIVSPDESLALYYDFNNYIGNKLGMEVETIIKRDYDVMNRMIKDSAVDVAFICTGAIAALDESEVRILAVPEVAGKQSYRSYIITNKSFDIKNISDLEGRSFAFTDRLSNSGTIYPSYLLIQHFNKSPEKILRKIYYTKSHDKSIFLINKGVVEAAAVDSLIFEFIKKKQPEKVENIKIIYTLPEMTSPPVVASSHISDEIFNKIRYLLLNMDKDPDGVKILKFLNIDRFVEAEMEDFNVIRKISETVEEFNSKNNPQKLQ